MKLEKKVTSRELSQRMVELGWDSPTERYWIEIEDKKKPWANGSSLVTGYGNAKDYRLTYTNVDITPAPDTAEIIKELPHLIAKEFILRIWKNENGFFLDYFNAYTDKPYLMDLPLSLQSGIKLCDSCGKMWIFLRERNLI